MASKYRYNPETLSYEKVKSSYFERFGKGLFFIVIAIITGFVLFFSGFSYLDSPKEKRLQREVEQLSYQYQILQKRINGLTVVLKDIQERDDNIYRVIFEADRIPSTIREAGFGGARRYEMLEGYDYADLMLETTKEVDKIEKQLYIQSKSFDEIVNLALKKEEMLRSIPAIQPVLNKDLTRMASGFGMRIHPIYKTNKMHTGMDFSATQGTEVFATGNGTVTLVTTHLKGYGTHITIEHGFGYETLYAHLNDVSVRQGQKVVRGDKIGTVGNTGTSTAPHLHYEVLKNGKPLNPVNFYFNDLSPEEYDQMILMSASINQSFD